MNFVILAIQSKKRLYKGKVHKIEKKRQKSQNDLILAGKKVDSGPSKTKKTGVWRFHQNQQKHVQ